MFKEKEIVEACYQSHAGEKVEFLWLVCLVRRVGCIKKRGFMGWECYRDASMLLLQCMDNPHLWWSHRLHEDALCSILAIHIIREIYLFIFILILVLHAFTSLALSISIWDLLRYGWCWYAGLIGNFVNEVSGQIHSREKVADWTKSSDKIPGFHYQYKQD